MSLLSLGKKIIDKYPALITITAFMHNHILGFNVIRLKRGNTLIGMERSYIKKSKVRVYGVNNTVDFGDTCFLEGLQIYINGNDNYIKLGRRVYAKGVEFHIEDSNNQLLIGDHTSFNGYSHLALTEGKKIEIGKDCMFSSNVMIRTGDSHSIIEVESRKRINEAMDVVIGEHVWLGNQVILLKGADIGANSLVGSGAVVTSRFEERNIIIAGNPAKIIKRGIDWNRVRI